ncbi:MAG: protein kinase domain-containing protein, partial [Blastocatellia bacterium]
LNAAHEKGIVHRDLKPENIMVHQGGEGEEMIKLIDFGIASVKDSKVATNAEKTKVAGALPYMAPEQLRGQPEASSDIWALGAMAYEMLTGRLPFYAETLVQLYELQKRGVQASPRSLRQDISPEVESILMKSMAFDPAERYQRAKDLGEDLARALTGDKAATGAQTASPTSPTPPSHATSESPAYGTMRTHSARTEVGGEVKASSTSDAKPKSSIGKIAIAVVAIAVIAVAIWLATRPDPPRQLSYSTRVLENPDKNPGKSPVAHPGEINFKPGDQLCLDLTSSQDGFFYLLSEDPETKDGLPLYNMLFPDMNQAGANTPSLKANQHLSLPSPQPPWYPIYGGVGTEKLWLIWSDHSIADLETARRWLNDKDHGEIKDTSEIKAIQQFINNHHPANKPVVEKDDQQTNLKGGKDGVL